MESSSPLFTSLSTTLVVALVTVGSVYVIKRLFQVNIHKAIYLACFSLTVLLGLQLLFYYTDETAAASAFDAVLTINTVILFGIGVYYYLLSRVKF